MRLSPISVAIVVSLIQAVPAFASQVQAIPQAEKEWTLLVYLNGDNSLDSFGPINLKEMESVGSTDAVDVVVQWASIQNGNTQRLKIQKSTDSSNVTSPILQDMGKVDMGDWRSLRDFIVWGAQHYPAKRYFVDVWDHGGGWHRTRMALGSVKPQDISWDDNSGNFITIPQLAQALREASATIKHPIDLYGSDACLMGMIEVANEVSDSVRYYLGSQETEPGDGWSYGDFLKALNANPSVDGDVVSKILADTYVKSYQGGAHGTGEATMAAYNMSKLAPMKAAINELGSQLQALDSAGRTKAQSASSASQRFAYSDYVDLNDFLDHMQSAQISDVSRDALSSVRDAMKKFVIYNSATSGYSHAAGLSIWLPLDKGSYDGLSSKYEAMKFATDTNWDKTLQSLLQQ